MSATFPSKTVPYSGGFLVGHDQLKPFLHAVAIFAVSVLVALSFTGLPG